MTKSLNRYRDGVSELRHGADYVVLDYAADHRDRALHEARLARVEAQGYDLVGSGPGLALLEKRP
ncbi:MAG TPA: hypothetical protein VNG93_01920 [Candidatus Dormibacteraeota bacterium]|nr:hypothetical protein [Candidatus Dormibacteraeota bacterium]